MQYSLLNLLRFFAAFLVVLSHFAYAISPFDEGFLNTFIGNGHFAVTFFFVLSGFVMTISNEKTDFEKSTEKIRFWKKRAIRLLPLYYFAIFLFIAFWWISKTPFNWSEIAQNIIGVQAWALNGSLELNPPGWSLSVEFLFYFLTPFILYWFSKRKFKHNTITIIALWACTAVISFFLLNGTNDLRMQFNFFPPLHIGTFLIGILTGKLWVHSKENLSFKKIHWAYLLIVLIALVCAFSSTYFHKKQISIYAPLFATLIFLLAFIENNYKNLKLKSFYNFLGDLSYPIYILHWPFYLYFVSFYGSENNLDRLAVYLVSLLLFSIAIHFSIERFFKKWYRKI